MTYCTSGLASAPREVVIKSIESPHCKVQILHQDTRAALSHRRHCQTAASPECHFGERRISSRRCSIEASTPSMYCIMSPISSWVEDLSACLDFKSSSLAVAF